MNGKLISKEMAEHFAYAFENERLFSNEIPQTERIDAALFYDLCNRKDVEEIEIIKGWDSVQQREMLIVAGVNERGVVVGDTCISFGLPTPRAIEGM